MDWLTLVHKVFTKLVFALNFNCLLNKLDTHADEKRDLTTPNFNTQTDLIAAVQCGS